jgi:hypothetical protein
MATNDLDSCHAGQLCARRQKRQRWTPVNNKR